MAYHFAGENKVVTYPWHNGLKVEQVEAHYDAEGWTEYKQAETGSSILKAQHPRVRAAIDYARQGEALAQREHLRRGGSAPSGGAAPAPQGASATEAEPRDH